MRFLVCLVVGGLALAGIAGAEPGAAEPEELDHLRALGYVDFSESAAPEQTGVTVHDPERSQPGYSLYASNFTKIRWCSPCATGRVTSWS